MSSIADAGDVLLLGVVHHRLARREHALRVGVAGRAVHVADHVLHDFVRRIETEHGQVADVELDDLVAVVFHLARLVHGRAADFVADVVELVRFQNRSQNISLCVCAHCCSAKNTHSAESDRFKQPRMLAMQRGYSEAAEKRYNRACPIAAPQHPPSAMKLHSSNTQQYQTVTGYDASGVEINAQRFDYSLIVMPETRAAPWHVARFDDLTRRPLRADRRGRARTWSSSAPASASASSIRA